MYVTSIMFFFNNKIIINFDILDSFSWLARIRYIFLNFRETRQFLLTKNKRVFRCSFETKKCYRYIFIVCYLELHPFPSPPPFLFYPIPFFPISLSTQFYETSLL